MKRKREPEENKHDIKAFFERVRALLAAHMCADLTSIPLSYVVPVTNDPFLSALYCMPQLFVFPHSEKKFVQPRHFARFDTIYSEHGEWWFEGKAVEKCSTSSSTPNFALVLPVQPERPVKKRFAPPQTTTIWHRFLYGKEWIPVPTLYPRKWYEGEIHPSPTRRFFVAYLGEGDMCPRLAKSAVEVSVDTPLQDLMSLAGFDRNLRIEWAKARFTRTYFVDLIYGRVFYNLPSWEQWKVEDIWKHMEEDRPPLLDADVDPEEVVVVLLGAHADSASNHTQTIKVVRAPPSHTH